MTVDGRPVCVLPPGERIEARFARGRSHLAQLAGTSFYHRLREKFGRLGHARRRTPTRGAAAPLDPSEAPGTPRACCTSCASRTCC